MTSLALERLDDGYLSSFGASGWLRSKLGMPMRDDPDAEQPAAAAEEASEEEW